MKGLFALNFIQRYLSVTLLRQRRPIFVGFSLTGRCPWQCRYCLFFDPQAKELSTDQVKHVLDVLSFFGTSVVQFTGGEPCLREDLGEIVAYAKAKQMLVLLSSSGFSLDAHAAALKNIDLIEMSLDGPSEIHDDLRGEGSFARVMKAAELLKMKNRKFHFCAVLTTRNADRVEDIVAIAEKFQTTVSFQPLWTEVSAGQKDMTALMLSPESLARVIDRIIVLKKKNKPIKVSLDALARYRKGYSGHPERAECVAGRFYFRVDTEGTMSACRREKDRGDTGGSINLLSADKREIKNYFQTLQVERCGHCLVSSLAELNALYHFKSSAIANAWNVLKGMNS